MNVLALCSHASPKRGSEFSVGWGWLTTIARDHDLWVITNDAARDEVEEFLASTGELDNVSFIFVPWDTRGVGSPIWKFIRPFRYMKWRRQALLAALETCERHNIQLCHHVNAVGFRDVVPLWKSGLPFVWGPVGGLSFVHPGLMRHVGTRARVFYTTKNFLRRLSKRFSRSPREAARHAAAIIAATEQTRSAIREAWGRDSTVISEVGSPEAAGAVEIRHREPDQPLKIVWSGRIHSGKAPQLALDAVAGLDSAVNWELTMIGDGPDREGLQNSAKRFGIATRCRFPGWLPRSDAIQTMAAAHVFILTSVYDLTSNVLVEALNGGLPVICLSSQSAASIVGEDCGVVVSVDKPEQIVTRLSAAVTTLFHDEASRRQMARQALITARQFDWEMKRRALQEIYNAALAR